MPERNGNEVPRASVRSQIFLEEHEYVRQVAEIAKDEDDWQHVLSDARLQWNEIVDASRVHH